MRVSSGQWAVLVFTLAYVGAFAAWFIARGNLEFLLYIATMLGLIALVALSLRSAAYPTALLWALSLWGLAHMCGGSIPAHGSVLYNLVLVPLGGEGELRLLKYDQVVHAYGFGVTAWLLWHLMARHHPGLRHSRTIYVYPALAAMGLGAVNEMIEFTAVMTTPDTNVGGYFNTALDLVFNALGATLAVLIIAWAERRSLRDGVSPHARP